LSNKKLRCADPHRVAHGSGGRGISLSRSASENEQEFLNSLSAIGRERKREVRKGGKFEEKPSVTFARIVYLPFSLK